jgi:hypothetical protein
VSTGFWVVAVLVIVIGIGAVLLNRYLHKQKVAAFTKFAGERGWHYAEQDNSLAGRYVGDPFGKGFGREAKHVLAGQHRGRDLIAFEYIYKEKHGSGKDSRTVTYRNTVVALNTPAARPTLEVSREGLGRKLLGLVGVRDLQLESEEFNKNFHIRTEDDKFAYDVLHPRTMEWMIADQRCSDLPFRFERADLLTWQKNSIDLPSVDAMVNYLCDVLERVPSFVWKS